MTGKIALALAAVILAPFFGGLVTGLDRRLTAWLQSRKGPPLLQPFYDALKLLGKAPMAVNPFPVLAAGIYLTASIASVFLFFLQTDLLLVFFVMTVGAVFLALGAMASPSPYSQIGAQRELIQMLVYEPLLLLVFVGLAMAAGSFRIEDVLAVPSPLLIQLPLLYVVLGYALTIKLRKSPFDISSCHHAHQELVRGVLTDYSGPQLAMIEIGHWFDVTLLLAICALFWQTSLVGMILLVAITYFLEILLDNVTARLTWRFMLRSVLTTGLVLSAVNMLWLYVE